MEQKFYICKHCGNIIAKVKDTGVPVICCGEPMSEIIPGTTDAAVEKHVPVWTVENGIVHVLSLIHILLDKANTESYGTPAPVTVPLTVEKGPFIVITGHDLHDLKLLLEQTEGKGVNIYTHGEMLPAHGYPELKKYAHLKGNFGTAWQNQQREFADIPAPVLFKMCIRDRSICS